MKFYSTTVGDTTRWTLDTVDGLVENYPQGTCYLKLSGNIAYVHSVSDNRIVSLGAYSSYKDINGVAYSSLSNFKDATLGFFV